MSTKVSRTWREEDQQEQDPEQQDPEDPEQEDSEQEDSEQENSEQGESEQGESEQGNSEQGESGDQGSDSEEDAPNENSPDDKSSDGSASDSSGGDQSESGEDPSDENSSGSQQEPQGQQEKGDPSDGNPPEGQENADNDPTQNDPTQSDTQSDPENEQEDGDPLHDEGLGEIQSQTVETEQITPETGESDESEWDNVRSQSASGDPFDNNNDDPEENFYVNRRYETAPSRIEDEIQDFAYDINEGHVGTDWTPGKIEDHRVARMLAVIIGKLAEDMSYQEIQGDEFWDAKKIMKRQIDKRPLADCKKDYKQRKLALLVDTSPSCRDEAVFYSKVSSGALLRDDVDIFLAPNGRIDARFDREHMRFITDKRHREWELEGRTVLYFTDWDGSSAIVKQSKNCNLYWFDNTDPQRYWESDDHRETRTEFRGTHYHCPEKSDFIKLARKIRP